jgi:hypothetical protein
MNPQILQEVEAWIKGKMRVHEQWEDNQPRKASIGPSCTGQEQLVQALQTNPPSMILATRRPEDQHHNGQQLPIPLCTQTHQHVIQGDTRNEDTEVANQSARMNRREIFRFGEQGDTPMTNNVENALEDTLSFGNEQNEGRIAGVRSTIHENVGGDMGGNLVNEGVLLSTQGEQRRGLDLNCSIGSLSGSPGTRNVSFGREQDVQLISEMRTKGTFYAIGPNLQGHFRRYSDIQDCHINGQGRTDEDKDDGC